MLTTTKSIRLYKAQKGHPPVEIVPIHRETDELQLLTEPHRNERFEVLWLKSGSCELTVDFTTFTATGGTAYCITPGQVHAIEPDADATGYLIYFNPDFPFLQKDNFDLLYNNGLFYTQGTISAINILPAEADSMEGLLYHIERELEKSKLLQSELLQGLLKVFLIELTRCFKSSLEINLKSRSREIVRQFLQLLDKNYATKKMVSDYADDMMVTPNYLNEVVKKVTGNPASHHIQRRVALEAKRQAKYEFKSMKEVAFTLGFDDLTHFSKFFKRTVGVNFTEFKKDPGAFVA